MALAVSFHLRPYFVDKLWICLYLSTFRPVLCLKDVYKRVDNKKRWSHSYSRVHAPSLLLKRQPFRLQFLRLPCSGQIM